MSAAFVFPESSAVAVTRGTEDRTFLSSHAGCYALHLSAWRPSIMLGHSHRGIVPPAVRLDTARGEPFAPDDTTSRKWWHRHETGRPLIRPGRGRMSSYWYPVDARTINLVWTTGHHGVRMALQNKETGYTGLANAFTDVVMPGLRNPRATVRAEPVDCSAVSHDSARLSPLSLPRGR